MTNLFKTSALAAATAATLAGAVPAASALPAFDAAPVATSYAANGSAGEWQHARRYDHSHNSYGQRRYYEEPVYRNTRTWRGNDGRYYCRKKDGTTGLIIGGAAGALIGREIAGRGDNTLGLLLGAAGGALLGREVDRGGSRRCR